MGNIKKIDSILMRELSMIISQELNDPLLGFPTVTEVDIASDYSTAKVYVSFLGKNYKKRDGLEALRRAKGHIKSLLAKRVNMRKIPDLVFVVDDSLDKADRIDKILKSEIKEDVLNNVSGGKEEQIPEEFDWKAHEMPTPIKDNTPKTGEWNFEPIGDKQDNK